MSDAPAKLTELGRRRRIGFLSAIPLPRPASYFYLTVALLLVLQALFEDKETPSALLMLIAISIIAAIFLNGLMAALTLNRLRVRATLPATVTAGARFEIECDIQNSKFLSGSALVCVNALGDRGFHERIGTYLASYVPARGRSLTSTKGVFLRRGTQRLQEICLSTTFPFGLMQARRYTRARNMVVVFPRPLPLPNYLYRRISSGGLRSKGLVRERGGNEEVYGLRRYVDGDPLSHLHWRTSARIGEPMVVMHDEERERDYRIVLDTWVSENSRPERQSLERLISLAAGALHFLHGRGARVGYRHANPEVVSVGEERGLLPKHQVLCEMADVGYSSSPLSEWSRRAFEGLGPDALVLLFTLSSGESLRGVVSTARVPVEVISIEDPMILEHLRSLGRYSLQSRLDEEEPALEERETEDLASEAEEEHG